MIYSLVVTSSPYSGQSSQTAARFALRAIDRGHRVLRIFFIDDGVYAGSDLAVPRQDEADLLPLWVELAQQHSVDLVLCISSALRRGLLDNTEAERYEKNGATAHPAFTISGLGQLVDAAIQADRLITFGCPR